MFSIYYSFVYLDQLLIITKIFVTENILENIYRLILKIKSANWPIIDEKKYFYYLILWLTTT